MTAFKNILVATDTQMDADPCVPRAVEIARHTGASLTFVDVVPEFPWSVRLTMKDYVHVHQLIEQEKRDALNQLAGPLEAEGLSVSTEVLTGRASVELIRESQRGNFDLLVCHAKASDTPGPAFFGETAMRLVKKCPCPTLLVDSALQGPFTHVAVCVDTSTGTEVDAELNNEVYDLGEDVARLHKSRFSVVHAWAFWNEQMLKGRIAPEVYEAMEGKVETQIAKLLDGFLQAYDRKVSDEGIYMVKGEPSEAIAGFAESEQVDLVVLGTVARSGLSGIIMGNTAERILGKLNCSVLAIKPKGFRSPVH